MKFNQSKIAVIEGGVILDKEYFRIRESELMKEVIKKITSLSLSKQLKLELKEQDSSHVLFISKEKKRNFYITILDNKISFHLGTASRNEKNIVISLLPKVYGIVITSYKVKKWMGVGLRFQVAIPLIEGKNAVKLIENNYSLITQKNPMGLGIVDSMDKIVMQYGYTEGNDEIDLKLAAKDNLIVLHCDRFNRTLNHYKHIAKFYRDAWNKIEMRLNCFTKVIFESNFIDEYLLKTGEKRKEGKTKK